MNVNIEKKNYDVITSKLGVIERSKSITIQYLRRAIYFSDNLKTSAFPHFKFPCFSVWMKQLSTFLVLYPQQ